MVFALTAVWLCTCMAGLLYHCRQRPDRQFPAWAATLLGGRPGKDCGPGDLAAAFMGRLWVCLLGITLFRALQGGDWLEPGAVLLAFAVPVAWSARRVRDGGMPLLPGLTGVRIALSLPDGYRVFCGRVSAAGPLAGVSLSALDLMKHGFLILAIGRSGRFIQHPKGTEVLEAGDLLLVYGRREPVPPAVRGGIANSGRVLT